MKRDRVFYGFLVLVIGGTLAHGHFARVKVREQLHTIIELREAIQKLELDTKNKEPLMKAHRLLTERALKLRNAIAHGGKLDEPKKKAAHIPFADE